MVAITGNTYPVKDQIRALGGRWNSTAKCWMVPDHVADQARALVSSAKSSPRKSGYGPKKCASCGSGINYGKFCGKCEFGR